MEYIKSKIRDVYDFPQKGVVFKDLTTVFKTASPPYNRMRISLSSIATKR